MVLFQEESDEICYILVTIPIISVFKTVKCESGGTCLLSQNSGERGKRQDCFCTSSTTQGVLMDTQPHRESEASMAFMKLSQLPGQRTQLPYRYRVYDTWTSSSQNTNQCNYFYYLFKNTSDKTTKNKRSEMEVGIWLHCNPSTGEGMNMSMK